MVASCQSQTVIVWVRPFFLSQGNHSLSERLSIANLLHSRKSLSCLTCFSIFDLRRRSLMVSLSFIYFPLAEAISITIRALLRIEVCGFEQFLAL